MTDLPVISLFSGAGGLDLGVEDAGGDIRVAVEPDPDCLETLLSNARFFPSSVLVSSPVERLSAAAILETAGLLKGEAALLIGGPPCQPFSKSGYWLGDDRLGSSDPRASLLDEFRRVLGGTRPEGFILENVASLTHPAHRDTLDGFVAAARRMGYGVTTRLLNAVEFGAPQTRTRLFILGLRDAEPPFPAPTNWWHAENGNRSRLHPPETAGRWIAHLDQDDLAEPSEVPSGRWLSQLREIPPGWNYTWHTEWAGHPNPAFVARTKYWSFLLKLAPNRPSWTVQASAGPWTGPLHWRSRRLRVPELAALQTFPSTYRFGGERASRRRQVGNAVPARLASRVAAPLLASIAGGPVRGGRRLRYRLAEGYEFDPATIRHNGRPW